MTSIEAVKRNTQLRRYFNPWSSIFFLRSLLIKYRHRDFFDGNMKSPSGETIPPMTNEQALAVLANEPTTLVIASAGSGKTHTIVMKIVFLVLIKKLPPERILALAFNRKAAAEITERVERFGITGFECRTFHSFGRKVLKTCGLPTKVSKFAQDPKSLKHWMFNAVSEASTKANLKEPLIRWLNIRKEQLNSYAEDINADEYRAYSGMKVKSRGELAIANFLIARGIKFEYEPEYSKIVDKNAPDYAPDFYIPSVNLFIEFFGIDRKGMTARHINQTEYINQIAWKRKVHEQFGTRLVEFYQYEYDEGILLEALENTLDQHNVDTSNQSPDTLQKLLDDFNAKGAAIDDFITAFLSNYKSSGIEWDELVSKVISLPLERREKAKDFLELFLFILTAYERVLTENAEIDFSDMISKAKTALKSQTFIPEFDNIIVDECQDLSAERYSFLNHLHQSSNASLCLVGDDWQSINRFAGSDLSVVTNPDTHFKKPILLFLNRTFRFGCEVAAFTSEFVRKNHRQIQKQTIGVADRPDGLFLLIYSQLGFQNQVLRAIDIWSTRENLQGKSILILARYKKLLPTQSDMNWLRSVWRGDILTPNTIHGSKGTEADYVIVVGVRGKITGKFSKNAYLSLPSEIVDDDLLDLVLPQPEEMPFAEERRLFYVAATRARFGTALFALKSYPSIFAQQIEDFQEVRVFGQRPQNQICSSCATQSVYSNIKFDSRSCEKCGFTLPKCSRCDEYSLSAQRCDLEQEGTKRRVHFICTDGACSNDEQFLVFESQPNPNGIWTLNSDLTRKEPNFPKGNQGVSGIEYMKSIAPKLKIENYSWTFVHNNTCYTILKLNDDNGVRCNNLKNGKISYNMKVELTGDVLKIKQPNKPTYVYVREK